LVLAYAIGATYDTTLSALLQTSVPAKIRGRVVSFQTMTRVEWGIWASYGGHCQYIRCFDVNNYWVGSHFAVSGVRTADG